MLFSFLGTEPSFITCKLTLASCMSDQPMFRNALGMKGEGVPLDSSLWGHRSTKATDKAFHECAGGDGP